MEKIAPQTYRAIIFGASGATGGELLKQLLASPKWEKVTVIARRKLDDWEKLPDLQKEKLDVVLCDNLDALSDLQKWSFPGYHSVFSLLGAPSMNPKERFHKIEYEYAVQTARFANFNKIPHFALLSAMASDSKSWFYHPRVKGEAERDIIAIGIPYTAIYRPGYLLNRPDARVSEKIAKWIPLVPKVDIKTIAAAMRIEAETRLNGGLDEKFDSKLKVKAAVKDGAKAYSYSNSIMKEILKSASN